VTFIWAQAVVREPVFFYISLISLAPFAVSCLWLGIQPGQYRPVADRFYYGPA